MTIYFEEGLDALQRFQVDEAELDSNNRNEATTRLHLVDRLFFECLGWDKLECEVEQPTDGKYADYIFSVQGTKLVVEAKREGLSFTLPAGTKRGILSIDYFKRQEPRVYKAIKQAVGYCTARGIQFGAVSNGHQVIAFLGSRTDGTPPMSGRALVFPTLSEMTDTDFHALWQTLSRSGIQERHLLAHLRAGDPLPSPEKLSARLLNYPGFRQRNNLQVDLQILAEILIQDIGLHPDNEREFLEKCYAESGALSQHALVSRKILETRYSQLYQSAVSGPQMFSANTRRGLHPNMLGDSATSKPILLIGDVGVGKTTFIRNLINVAARDILDKGIVLYLDLGVKPTITMALDQFIAGELTRQLRSDHDIDIEELSFLRGVYHIDLQQFEKGIWGSVRELDPAEFARRRAAHLEDKIRDIHEHLRRCFDHIVNGQQRQVVIFFDNLDQRSNQFQQDAFLLGQSIAELWPVTVFMTLRPETYHRSRATGTLDAYHQRAFTIEPPRIDVVVEKRLGYGIDLLETGKLHDGNISLESYTLKTYLEILTESFRTNGDLKEFIDNVCGGNVRLALDFIKTFIGSGHVNTDKIINAYKATGRYTVPLHEFVRAVMYLNYRWYDPTASEIKNVFDVSERDGREHFIVLCAVAFVERRGQTSDLDGYVPRDELASHLGSLGFRASQIRVAVNRMVDWKLVESITKDRQEDVDARLEGHLRLTTIGAYYYRRLVSTFQYLDAVVVDTPVMDADTRLSIREAQTIVGRLNRAELFYEYLDGQWGELGEAGAVFDWKNTLASARHEIERIRSAVDAPPTQPVLGSAKAGFRE